MENNQGWEVWQDSNPSNDNIEPNNPSPVWMDEDTSNNNNQINFDSSEPLFEWNESENNNNFPNTDVSNNVNNISSIGRTLLPEIFKDCYSIIADNKQIISEIENISLSETETNGLYDFNPEENSSLGLLIKNIFNIGKQFNLRISNCYVYNNNTNEQFLNKILGKNENSQFSFIYFVSNTDTNNFLSLDFSELKGPNFNFINPTLNTLYIFPSWLPVKTSSFSQNGFKAIVGTFNLG